MGGLVVRVSLLFFASLDGFDYFVVIKAVCGAAKELRHGLIIGTNG
jgi:hypothetical protein